MEKLNMDQRNTYMFQKLIKNNIFDSCVFKLLKKNELKLLDHKLVGLPYSKIISQTKNPKKYWEKIGSPNYKLCKLNK